MLYHNSNISCCPGILHGMLECCDKMLRARHIWRWWISNDSVRQSLHFYLLPSLLPRDGSDLLRLYLVPCRRMFIINELPGYNGIHGSMCALHRVLHSCNINSNFNFSHGNRCIINSIILSNSELDKLFNIWEYIPISIINLRKL